MEVTSGVAQGSILGPTQTYLYFETQPSQGGGQEKLLGFCIDKNLSWREAQISEVTSDFLTYNNLTNGFSRTFRMNVAFLLSKLSTYSSDKVFVI